MAQGKFVHWLNMILTHKNITSEKPTAIWLLGQVRRAGQDEQKVVFDWLLKKFNLKLEAKK